MPGITLYEATLAQRAVLNMADLLPRCPTKRCQASPCIIAKATRRRARLAITRPKPNCIPERTILDRVSTICYNLARVLHCSIITVSRNPASVCFSEYSWKPFPCTLENDINTTYFGSLGVCRGDVSESRTCSGSLRRAPNGESSTLTLRNPKEPLFPRRQFRFSIFTADQVVHPDHCSK